MDTVYKNLDESNIIMMIFIDLEAEFPSINYNEMKRMLIEKGIQGKEYKWLINYIQNNRQYTNINNNNSKEIITSNGVCQGTSWPQYYLISI